MTSKQVVAAALMSAVLAPQVARRAEASHVNKALALRWAGYVDTDTSFSDFFGQNHTLVARFMPQYPRAYAGPILTVDDGSSAFVLRQARYDKSDGQTGLGLRVGSVSVDYPYPLQAGTWYHLAVTRRWVPLGFGSLRFDLYVNGQPVCPDPAVSPSCALFVGSAPIPNGRIRIGRINADTASGYQVYGFVDDVAVFDHAVSVSEIGALVLAPRLTGNEPGLQVGYTFDSDPVAQERVTTLSSVYEVHAQALRTIVSNNRSISDAAYLPNPYPDWTRYPRLPFKPGQAWQAGQGYAQPGSHNGTSAFSYDFWLLDANSQTLGKEENPNAPGQISCGEPVHAIAAGTVTSVGDSGGYIDPDDLPGDDGINDDYDNPNHVRVRMAPRWAAVYLHLFTGSIQEAFPDRLFFPSMDDPSSVGYQFSVNKGEPLGTVGTRNSCHLHLSTNNDSVPQVTVPVGFFQYQACDADCLVEANWYDVFYGVPKDDQWVRNPL